MKKILLVLLAGSFFAACNSPKQDQTETVTAPEEQPEAPAEVVAYFGEEINMDDAVASSEVTSKLADQQEMDMKVAATINTCCQKKGCWMTVSLGEEDEMMVRFKDYGFFVPKDADGYDAVFEGRVFRDTVDVATLQHYAEDAGKTTEEIEAITEPEIRLAFEASGVAIKGYEQQEEMEEEGHDHDHGEEHEHGEEHDHDHDHEGEAGEE